MIQTITAAFVGGCAYNFYYYHHHQLHKLIAHEEVEYREEFDVKDDVEPSDQWIQKTKEDLE